MRKDNRANNELRPIKFSIGYLKKHEGSVLVTWGNTKVICLASSEEKVPPHRIDKGGWLTAEYNMLPGSTNDRKARSFFKGNDGRAVEISRLIGRSLRQAINLKAIGQRTITIDCDVVEADAGTRCASITAGYLALCAHVAYLLKSNQIKMRTMEDIIIRPVAAVSIGIVNNSILSDIDYREDLKADVDCNIIGTSEDQLIDIQCTAERRPLNQEELDQLLSNGKNAIRFLLAEQEKALAQKGIIFNR